MNDVNSASSIDPSQIIPEQGLAWLVRVASELGPGDTVDNPTLSHLRLLEAGHPIGPAHARHDDIRRYGGGAYSHWQDMLYFSTSDRSDPRINGRRYLLAVEPQPNRSIPEIVGIETINTCNARCPFCPLFQGSAPMNRATRPAAIMEWHLFEKCIDEIVAWPTQPGTIFLNMDGEPLQDPLFEKRLWLIAEARLGPRIVLQSNAHFLSPRLAQAILKANIGHLTIGFDGATKETYERHRVRCDYDRVLHNIRRFVDMRQQLEGQTRIGIQYVRTRDNAHEVVAAYDMFSQFLDSELDIFNDTFSKDWGDLGGEESFFVLPKTTALKEPEGCDIFDAQLIVHCDGTIAACCWDYNLAVSGGGFGNIARDKLIDLWHSAKRTDLRRRLKQGPLRSLPEKCRACPGLTKGTVNLSMAKMQGPHVIPQEYGFVYRFTR